MYIFFIISFSQKKMFLNITFSFLYEHTHHKICSGMVFTAGFFIHGKKSKLLSLFLLDNCIMQGAYLCFMARLPYKCPPISPMLYAPVPMSISFLILNSGH